MRTRSARDLCDFCSTARQGWCVQPLTRGIEPAFVVHNPLRGPTRLLPCQVAFLCSCVAQRCTHPPSPTAALGRHAHRCRATYKVAATPSIARIDSFSCCTSWPVSLRGRG